jgi:hypothetical protein
VYVLLAMLPCIYGQRLSFGIIGGGMATGGLDPTAQDTWEGKRYTFGPAVEFGLPFRLSAELDALYRRAGSSIRIFSIGTSGYSSRRADVLEFPLQLKCRLGRGPVRPFVAGGLAVKWVRHASANSLSFVTNPFVLNAPTQYVTYRYGVPAETHAGPVVSGGIEFAAGRLRLAPEFRYTRWSGRYWEFSGSHGYFTGPNPNQAELLFELLF